MAKLLSSLDTSSLVKFGSYSVNGETPQPIIWEIVAKSHSGYPSESVTLATQKIIDLRAFDAIETGQEYGNRNYALSNIHQWLNSDGAANNWYSPTHSTDVAPTNDTTSENTGYQSRPGFLHYFSNVEKRALLPTTLTVQVGTDVSSTISAKVFLPSAWETLGSYEISDGSSQLSKFSYTGEQRTLTEQAFSNSYCSALPSSSANFHEYWTRSTSTTSRVITVTTSGKEGSASPYDGSVGVLPLVNLSANSIVSDSADSNGYYTLYLNTAPTISESNKDLGDQDVEFSQTYTISDKDEDVVTVTEYIDNVKIRSYVATLDATNTFDVRGNTWLKLSNGIHTLKIVANDGTDESTRTFTFTKKVEKLVVQRANPMESSTMPTYIIVTVVKNIPLQANCKIEVCNNGFDDPTKIVWEEITSGELHKFNNTACDTGKWGVNIRVTVDRNGAEGACYITEIGGNFE